MEEQLKAKLFVDFLLSEGADTPCDGTLDGFRRADDKVPPFYNEDLFKKGQEFYQKNRFAIFSAKIFGLISVLAIPTILDILVHTKRSSSSYTAYQRYVATILHMTIWYEEDFRPGASKLWNSLVEVQNLHNSASESGCKKGLKRISQKDMVLTQFGFMGYQLVHSEVFGIHNGSQEDWEGFLHLWRVIAYQMGVEDRFNLCAGSVSQTKAICNELLQRVFQPKIQEKNPKFLEMCQHLVNGLWTIQPMLNFNVTMYLLEQLLPAKTSTGYQKFNLWEKCLCQFLRFIYYALRWAPFRWYFNHTQKRDLWLIRNFPFLAYYKFGWKKSVVVKILHKNS